MPRQSTPWPLAGRLGARIRELRLEANMSLRELAEKSGLAQGHLSDIENGRVNVQVQTLAAAADGIGVDLLDLLNYGDQSTSERARFVELSRRLTPKQIERETAKFERMLRRLAKRKKLKGSKRKASKRCSMPA
ncbi:helix-turn-helix domain-containing protein [Polyangium aurulentum]|uniref:helix-turn-helix domain-containing protein n=1 Tax=Polyangium aurulentum TaxID=2567896 RepID=UPI0010ADF9B8|nr:helix-turn-helix domain-containing protein [Polyangium aurulentum]UQA57067.1 helix-turn-helix domain-containing protein [Polyangium aurulentum]